MRCLEKSAADRYERGNELADALIGFLSPRGGRHAVASPGDLARIRTPSLRG